MSDLKPCPFCGNAPRLLGRGFNFWPRKIICDTCNLSFESDDNECSRKWNQRAGSKDDYVTLQAELAKSKDEARQLHSQLKALKGDAELGAAIQHACGELPEGYILTLYLERWGSGMELGLPGSDAVYDDFDGDHLPGQIKDAVEKAKALDEGCIDE